MVCSLLIANLPVSPRLPGRAFLHFYTTVSWRLVETDNIFKVPVSPIEWGWALGMWMGDDGGVEMNLGLGIVELRMRSGRIVSAW